MTKPTKTQLIQIRDQSYREQPVECCGTCKHFWHSFSRDTVGECAAVRTIPTIHDWKLVFLDTNTSQEKVYYYERSIDTAYLGICDLYEPRKDGVK